MDNRTTPDLPGYFWSDITAMLADRPPITERRLAVIRFTLIVTFSAWMTLCFLLAVYSREIAELVEGML